MESGTRGTSGKPPEGSMEVDEQGFVKPKRKRGRPRKKTRGEDNESVCSSNTFETLNDDDTGDEMPLKRNRQKRIRRPPPIIIPNLNHNQVDERMKELKTVQRTNITKRITRDGVKLFVTTNDEFRSVREHLNQSKTKYKTYTLDEDKHNMYVMYGLPNFPVAEVQAAFANIFHVKPTSIKYMKLAKKVYPEQMNYLIYFQSKHGVTLADLKRITGLLGFHVFFDNYKRSSDPCQCYNCQGFTHASANCTLDPRCVRCSGVHKSSECPLVNPVTGKIPDEKVRCANCNGSHTANARECPFRTKLINDRKAMAAQRTKNTRNGRYVNQFNDYNINFPALTKNNVNKLDHLNVTQTAHAWSRAPAETITQPNQNSNLLTARQLMNVFMEMVRICTSCKSKEEQLNALVQVVEKYVIND